MENPRTREKEQKTKKQIHNCGKSRAEKLDAFADPKRQMTEKTKQNNKRDNTRIGVTGGGAGRAAGLCLF